jgi:transcriptional regulator with XRE-family HTH domain
VDNTTDQAGDKRAQQLSLGQLLRQAREVAGLSIRQLEATSGVGRMAIQRLEQDEVEKPAADHLLHLAQALELNETDLFLLARLPLPKRTASLDVMLRKEYGLPPEAIAEAKRNIQDLIDKYDSGREV